MVEDDESSSIVVAEPHRAIQVAALADPQAVIHHFLRSQTEFTRKAYHQDLLAFARDVKVVTMDPTLERGSVEKKDAQTAALGAFGKWLFSASPLEGNAAAARFVEMARERGDAAATINRRLAAVKSLLKLGRALGHLTWTIEIKNVRGKKQRDTRGPELDEVKLLLTKAKEQSDAGGTRDYAMLLLLFVRGLRSIEVRELNLEHLDVAKGTVAVRGKGDLDRTSQTIPPMVVEAIRAWLRHRGDEPGPLFTSHAKNHKGGRITRSAFWKVITKAARDCGVNLRPHGLRHAAITQGLNLTNGNVRTVRAFSRHARIQTVMEYDDARQDFGGEIADRIAALVQPDEEKQPTEEEGKTP